MFGGAVCYPPSPALHVAVCDCTQIPSPSVGADAHSWEAPKQSRIDICSISASNRSKSLRLSHWATQKRMVGLVNGMRQAAVCARLIRYSLVCGRSGVAEKKSCLRRSHLALFFPPHRPIKPFIPGFFPQPSEKSQISTTKPSLVLFSSTSFLTFHKKPTQKKLKITKKSRYLPINLPKTKKAPKPPRLRPDTDLPLEDAFQPFFQSRSRFSSQERTTEALSSLVLCLPSPSPAHGILARFRCTKPLVFEHSVCGQPIEQPPILATKDTALVAQYVQFLLRSPERPN